MFPLKADSFKWYYFKLINKRTKNNIVFFEQFTCNTLQFLLSLICGLYIRTIRDVHRLNFHILKLFEFKFWIERSINPVLTDSSFGFIKFNLSSTLRKKNEKYKHWTTYAYSVKFRTLDSLFVRLGMKYQDLKTN